MEERYVAKGAILNRFNTHPPVTRRRRIDSIHELPTETVMLGIGTLSSRKSRSIRLPRRK
jgi:hypothetical protein